mgnify:CR=1 FL=1
MEYKISSTFTSDNIKESKVVGEIIIEGTINKVVQNRLRFFLHLTYPEGVSMLCSLTSFEAGPSSIICKVDRDINSEQIIIEQTIIRYENNEILVITGIVSEKSITCENGLLLETEEKMEFLSDKQLIFYMEIMNFLLYWKVYFLKNMKKVLILY